MGDVDKRKKYDEFRRSAATGGFGGGFPTGFNRGRRRGQARLRHQRPAAGAGRWCAGSATCSATSSAVVADASASAGHRAPPRATTWRRRHARLRGRPRRDDDLAAADLRRGLPDLPGHGGQARHPSAHLPRVRGRRLRRRRPRAAAFSMNETCPACGGRQLRLRRRVPHLPRLGPRPVDPHDPGPHPGRGQGRPEDPAARQGRARARTAARPATSSSPSASARTPSSAAAATTSPSRSRSRSTRLPSGADIKIPTLGGAPVTLKVPPARPTGARSASAARA